MSRLPRFQEHLKTGFTAEAVSAATYRAYAEQAHQSGLPNLASRWRQLAEEKDSLARLQLQAAGKIGDAAAGLQEALAEERYENEVLYPAMIRDVDGETAEVFEEVVTAQKKHATSLQELVRDLQASGGDVS